MKTSFPQTLWVIQDNVGETHPLHVAYRAQEMDVLATEKDGSEIGVYVLQSVWTVSTAAAGEAPVETQP